MLTEILTIQYFLEALWRSGICYITSIAEDFIISNTLRACGTFYFVRKAKLFQIISVCLNP